MKEQIDTPTLTPTQTNSAVCELEQIKEMARVLEFVCDLQDEDSCISECDTCRATALYNAGYRKQSEEGAECPTCHGTGRIGTTDWLTKNISKKQLAEEKAKAIAEHEQYIKTDVAWEIFNEIYEALHDRIMAHHVIMSTRYAPDEKILCDECVFIRDHILKPIEKKYTEGQT